MPNTVLQSDRVAEACLRRRRRVENERRDRIFDDRERTIGVSQWRRTDCWQPTSRRAFCRAAGRHKYVTECKQENVQPGATDEWSFPKKGSVIFISEIQLSSSTVCFVIIVFIFGNTLGTAVCHIIYMTHFMINQLFVLEPFTFMFYL